MTKPTIEHVLEEIRRLPVRCEIQKLDNCPSDEFLRGWAVGIAMAAKTAKDECSKLSQLVSALTAQAGDGNLLPLEEVPEGWVVFNIGNDDPDGVDFSWYALLREKAVPGMSSADSGDRRIVGADGATPAEALRAAIAAENDGAG